MNKLVLSAYFCLIILLMVFLAGCDEDGGTPYGSVKDSDGDDLYDWYETDLGTNPYEKDTDGDGIEDGSEVMKRNTDPLNVDTDGDGQWDGDEILQGTDPLDNESYYVPEDYLQPYGKRNYNVTESSATYADNTITVTYKLQDDQGYMPSTNKSGCIMLINCPDEYEPGIDDLAYYSNFDESGRVTYTRSTGIVVGTYVYEFCGIFKYEEGEYVDQIEYVGDGDRVTVEVEPIPIIKVVETNVTQVGTNLYDCRWYFTFSDGSSGILDYVNVGQLNNALRIHCTNPESDGYWGNLGFYDDDYIKVMVTLNHDWITMEIDWIDDSEIGYEGDGDPITIYRD